MSSNHLPSPPRQPSSARLSSLPTPEDAASADLLDDEEDAAQAHLAADQVETLRARLDASHHGKRLDVVLAQLVPAYSRNHLQTLVERGLVQLNGLAVTSPSKKVLAGQTLQALLEPTAQARAFTPEAMDIPVVFEDDHLLVVNKPAGWVVHPAAGNWSGTLLNGLLAHHQGAFQLPRAGIVHRLDKDTSGLMVVGKTLLACTALSRMIADRQVHRQYVALVWGQPPATLTIEAALARDPVTRIKMAVLATGKPARTDVITLASCKLAPDDTQPGGVVSAVRCVLHTGRTHQIRVHLSHKRWPLVADTLYGGRPAFGLARQALHAEKLCFAHPVSSQEMTFEAPLPPDLAQAWVQVTGQAHAS